MSHDMRLVGLIAAAVAEQNEAAIAAAYEGLPADLADFITSEVNALLAMKGDWHGLVWAAPYLRTTWHHIAMREFYEGEPAAAPAAPRRQRPHEVARKRVSALCFKLLRSGTTAQILAKRARTANAGVADPLPEQELNDLVVWCAKQHLEGRTNA